MHPHHNLTIPAAHAEIALRAIDRGKHVYAEKPLAASFPDARSIIDAAAEAGVGVGCAPDTVLGTGTQTARAAIDAGLIGRPPAGAPARTRSAAPGPAADHRPRLSAGLSTGGRSTDRLSSASIDTPLTTA